MDLLLLFLFSIALQVHAVPVSYFAAFSPEVLQPVIDVLVLSPRGWILEVKHCQMFGRLIALDRCGQFLVPLPPQLVDLSLCWAEFILKLFGQ